jgi:glucokinase
MSAVLFDFGGSYVRCALMPSSESDTPTSITQLRKSKIPNFLNCTSAGEIWEKLTWQITHYLDEIKYDISVKTPILISFPGPVSSDGTILAAPTLIGKSESMPGFRRNLEQATGREVCIINDMSAAAWRASTCTSAKRFLVITVSSGIGSKVFDHTSRSKVIDEHPYAGEIGHITIDESPYAPACDCGGRGHLGAISSARAIERFARSEAIRDPNKFKETLCAKRFGGTADSLTNEEHLVPAALAGDAWVIDVITCCTEPLGRVIAIITIALGLEGIVIIGGFAQNLGAIYRRILEKILERQVVFQSFLQLKNGFITVQPAEEEVCLLGLATYGKLRYGLSLCNDD